MANARTRWVVARLNQLVPELTIHLGDLVHPVPALPTYAQAAHNFRELTRALRSPLHPVPGNHDVGDKPVAWAPAATVSDTYLALWREHFGEQFYAFDVRGLHFVVVNASIINSGLAAEAGQRDWLERDLASSAGRRTFLCIHYPPYVSRPDESESYDNLAEPGRSWLLDLIETYRPEAMFCGHVHNFWYNRHGDTDCYILPSTAFVRHDYSELYRVAPAPDAERGRNDLPKLGFFAVRIYERGHVCHVIRTYGATLDPGAALAPAPETVTPLHTRENVRAPLGLDLRQPWAEMVEITPTGAVDEFERKKVRNDYPLLALWEMGVRTLRVPFQDLEDAALRDRMRLLHRLGHRFIVYTFEVPHGRARDLLIEHHDVVDAWEVVARWPDVARIIETIAEIKGKAPLAVSLSKLRGKEHARPEGGRFYHFIDHGFVPSERDAIEQLVRTGARDVIDGVTYRILRQDPPWREIGAVAEIAAALGLRATVLVRMASQNPAQAFDDDLANANRVAEALTATMAHSTRGVDVLIDGFADIDRGYFVRTGLVDRRWNPRLGAHVVRNLHAALNENSEPLVGGEVHDVSGGRVVTLHRPTELLALILPEPNARLDGVPACAGPEATAGVARVVDLETGSIERLRWQRLDERLALDG
ncbi:MAG: metallophosphoesterase, partial [Candidatus Rokuibacteriota bacterium]